MHRICSLSPLVCQCLQFISLGSLKIWAYCDKQHLLPYRLNPSKSYSRVFLPLWNDLVNLCRNFSTGLLKSKSSGVGTVIALTGTQFLPVTMDSALFIQYFSTCTPLTAPADPSSQAHSAMYLHQQPSPKWSSSWGLAKC